MASSSKRKGSVKTVEWWDHLRWDGSTIGAVIFEHCEFVVGKGVNARALCAVKDPYELGLFIIGNIHENPELLENPND